MDSSRSFTTWLMRMAIIIAVLSVGVVIVSRVSAGAGGVDDSIALTSDMTRSIETGPALDFLGGSSTEIPIKKFYPGDIVLTGFQNISNESPDARWALLGISFDTTQGGWVIWIVETKDSNGSWSSGPVVVFGNSTTQVEFRIVVGNGTQKGAITGPRLVLNESPIPLECPAGTECG